MIVYSPAGAHATVKLADAVCPRSPPLSRHVGFEMRPLGLEEIVQLVSERLKAAGTVTATSVPIGPEDGVIVMGGIP